MDTKAHPSFAQQAEQRGYLIEGKLRAIYTKNKLIVDYEAQVEDGDVIRIMVPIVGG